MKRITLTLASFLLAAAPSMAADVAGTVRDAVTGSALAGVRIEILGAGHAVTTDAAGAFAVAAPDVGPVTLAVSHPGYHVHRLVVPAGTAAALDVRLAPVVSYADGIEVTATRAETGRDPATLTNLTQERIAENHWGQDPAMLLADVAPGFFAYNDNGNGIGYSYFTIRGFGQARTRVTINGAPLNDAESGELFFIDLADFMATSGDVQIRRGVFGLSGIGGAVDLTSAPPPVEPSFALHLGAGSFATRRGSVRYESGLIDGRWSLSARASKVSTDGYRDQSWVDSWNVHLGLTRYGERSRLRLILLGGPERTHLAYNGVPQSTLDGGLTGDAERDRRFNPLTWEGEVDEFFQPHVQIVHELEISPSTRLDETLYLFQGDGFYDQYRTDRAFVEYNLPDVTLPDGTVVTETDLVRRRNVDEWDAGWTPVLTHVAGAWELTAAGELRLHEAHHVGEVRWTEVTPPGTMPDHRYYDYRVGKRTASLAAGAKWTATPGLVVSAGLQVAHHRYEMSDDAIRGVAFTQGYDFLLPRLGAVLRVATDTDIYLNVARGMREPAFRQLYDPQDYYGTRVYLDPEDVLDAEAGVSVRRRTWNARANLFWMRFANEIVYAGAIDDNGVPVYGNGARSVHRGAELDASWQPSDRVGLDAALTLSQNTFTDYREYGWDGSVNVYDGNRIAGYPDLIASITARTRIGGVLAALTARHVGRFYLDNTEDNRQSPAATQEPGYVPLVNPSFTLVDLSMRGDLPARLAAAVGLGRIGLELRLNNLLDETYTAFGYVEEGTPLFIPAAGRNLYAGVTLGL